MQDEDVVLERKILLKKWFLNKQFYWTIVSEKTKEIDEKSDNFEKERNQMFLNGWKKKIGLFTNNEWMKGKKPNKPISINENMKAELFHNQHTHKDIIFTLYVNTGLLW